MPVSRSVSSSGGPVLLAGGALLATLLALELLLQALTLSSAIDRYLFPVMIGWRESDYEALFDYNDQFVKYLLRPVRGFRHVHDGGEYDYEINTIPCSGFFVRPPCHLGPDTSFHFGDSFTFGFGVAEDETFVSLLDQSGPGRHVNFGVPGDDLLAEIDHARMLLSELPKEDHPRALYFHAFFGNDIRDAWKYLGRAGELTSEERQTPVRLSRLVKKSKLRRLVKNRLKAIRFQSAVGRPVPDGFTFVPKHLTALEDMDPKSLATFDRVASACAARMGELRGLYGGDIVVTLIPPKEIFFLADDTAPYDRRRDVVAAAFRPHDVIVIDMLETIPPSEILPLFFKIDTHFNRDGHERFARILRSHPPLSGLASAVQLDTPVGRPYRRGPELELPRSTP
jgi:hypothetical protein